MIESSIMWRIILLSPFLLVVLLAGALGAIPGLKKRREEEKMGEREETIAQMFKNRVEKFGSRPALYKRRGNEWKSITYAEFGEQAKYAALGLYALGVRQKDCVCVLSTNRPEWLIADFGILSAGAVTVPVYPTLTPKDMVYIINHCSAKALLVEDEQMLEKIRPVENELPELSTVCVINGSFKKLKKKTLSLKELLSKGIDLAKEKPALYDSLTEGTGWEDLATIIYTSGTTGPPKGAMISNKNILYVCKTLGEIWPMEGEERHLSYLPLSHVFERVAGEFYSVSRGAGIYFAESLDTIAQDAQDSKPTLFIGVPRVYEKMYERMKVSLQQETGLKKSLVDWAMSAGKQVTALRQEGKNISLALQTRYRVAEALVYKKFRARMGGEVQFFVSGAAPLSPEIQHFFHSAGLLLFEGYGLTETTAPATINLPENFQIGTVGKALPAVKIKIAGDGEILIKGDNVFHGYYKNDEATKEALVGGWLHTGDVGQLDRNGFLKITDRKKDLLITAGGKNVAPQNIENSLKTSPYISQAVVLGDRKPYLVALITLNKEQIEKFAKEKNIDLGANSDFVSHPEIQNLVDAIVEEKNGDLAKFETIKKYRILNGDFSVDTGELTPTMKVKRKVVMEKYGNLVEEMYQS